jgi:hypothetical protein
MPIGQGEYNWLAEELHCYAKRITPEMSAFELKQALRGVPGSEDLTISLNQNGNQTIHMGDKTLEVGPMASNDEIIAALQNPFIRTENTKMSITGFQPGAIKAAIDAAKQNSQDKLTAAMAKLAAAQTRAQSVPDAINEVAAKMEKEADDALQELATFTNGGPA